MKIYSGIEGIEIPEYSSFNGSYEDYSKACDEYEQRLIEYCRVRTNYKYAGEIVKFGVADGYACYVVVNRRELIHIGTGDSYWYPYVHRLTAKDIAEQIESQKAMRALFSKQGKRS